MYHNNNFTLSLKVGASYVPISSNTIWQPGFLNFVSNEVLNELEHSQYILTFDLMLKKYENNKLLTFPLSFYIFMGAFLRLEWNNQIIDLVISAISPSHTNNNIKYSITAQDEVSYLWAKQHSGYSFRTEDNGGNLIPMNIYNIGRRVLDDNFLSETWSIVLWTEDDNDDVNTDMGYDSLTQQLFSLEVNNSNPYNVLIEACNIVDAYMKVDYKSHTLDFFRKKDVKDSGYRYYPYRNLLDFSVNYSADELTTFLRVIGGTDANEETITLIPTLSPALQKYVKKYYTQDSRLQQSWDRIEAELISYNDIRPEFASSYPHSDWTPTTCKISNSDFTGITVKKENLIQKANFEVEDEPYFISWNKDADILQYRSADIILEEFQDFPTYDDNVDASIGRIDKNPLNFSKPALKLLNHGNDPWSSTGNMLWTNKNYAHAQDYSSFLLEFQFNDTFSMHLCNKSALEKTFNQDNLPSTYGDNNIPSFITISSRYSPDKHQNLMLDIDFYMIDRTSGEIIKAQNEFTNHSYSFNAITNPDTNWHHLVLKCNIQYYEEHPLNSEGQGFIIDTELLLDGELYSQTTKPVFLQKNDDKYNGYPYKNSKNFYNDLFKEDSEVSFLITDIHGYISDLILKFQSLLDNNYLEQERNFIVPDSGKVVNKHGSTILYTGKEGGSEMRYISIYNTADSDTANGTYRPVLLRYNVSDALQIESELRKQDYDDTVYFLSIAKKIPYINSVLINFQPFEYLFNENDHAILKEIKQQWQLYHLKQQYQILQSSTFIFQIQQLRTDLTNALQNYAALIQSNQTVDSATMQSIINTISSFADIYATVKKQLGKDQDLAIFIEKSETKYYIADTYWQEELESKEQILRAKESEFYSNPDNLALKREIDTLLPLCRDTNINIGEDIVWPTFENDISYDPSWTVYPGAYDLIQGIVDFYDSCNADANISKFGDFSEQMFTIKEALKDINKRFYTHFHNYIYEQSYENTEELNHLALYNQALAHFTDINKYKGSYSAEVLDIASLECVLQPKLHVGNFIYVYNPTSLKKAPYIDILNKIDEMTYLYEYYNHIPETDSVTLDTLQTRIIELQTDLLTTYNNPNMSYAEVLNEISTDVLYITSISRVLREPLKDSITVEEPSRYKTILSKLIKSI